MEKEVEQNKDNPNLDIYNKVKSVPDEAKRKIKGGRLKGMTDIKPMWRIQKLTELFGVCGIGWKAPIKNKTIIEGANGEKIAIVDIDLYIKVNEEWSEPIEGTGGSSFVSKENNGLYTSDECFKMAYTDAISVACKSLGMGADVYWGDSKYQDGDKKNIGNINDKITDKEAKTIYAIMLRKGLNIEQGLKTLYNVSNTKDLTKNQYFEILKKVKQMPDKEVSNGQEQKQN